MRKSVLIFLTLAFLAYWLIEGQNAIDGDLSFGTITPTIKRIVEPKKVPEPAEAPPASAARTPASSSSLEPWLKSEALKIGRIDPNPDQTHQRLKQKATRLDGKELRTLKRLALTTNLSADARFLAVYLLSLAQDAGAVTLLKEVCLSRIPDSLSDREHSDELILRAQSLEALVQRLSPGEARKLLQEILTRASDPILAQQARYWLSKLS